MSGEVKLSVDTDITRNRNEIYIVDSCIWIDFFSYKKHFEAVSILLTDNCTFVNKVILAELLPSAK
jgi:hypothetical protein